MIKKGFQDIKRMFNTRLNHSLEQKLHVYVL